MYMHRVSRLLPVGQPPVLKLLSRWFWGLSPRRGDSIHGLAWNLPRLRWPKVPFVVPNFTLIREYLGVSPPKNEKLPKWLTCRPAVANPLPDVGEIHRIYAVNRSTEVVKIRYDSVGKLKIYKRKPRWRIFTPKFSESLSSETILADWIINQRGATRNSWATGQISKSSPPVHFPTLSPLPLLPSLFHLSLPFPCSP